MAGRQDDEHEEVQHERGEFLERLSGWLDAPLTVLALVSLALLILELSGVLSPAWAERVELVQTAIWVLFAVVFAFELLLAPDKLVYLKRHWITAIAVLLPAFRSVRVLRVARALRGLRLVRIVTALNRGTRALGQIAQKGEFGYVLLLTVVVTLTAAAGAYYFERGAPGATITSFGEALWWAAAIVTTINSPLSVNTLEGRVVGVLLRIFGVAVSGYLTATIAVYLLGGSVSLQRAGSDNSELQQLRLEVARLRETLSRTDSASEAQASREMS